jgi:hypothetical protein
MNTQVSKCKNDKIKGGKKMETYSYANFHSGRKLQIPGSFQG